MREIILHIGAHKTGTTYIQRVFFDNHKALKDKRVLYPLRWTNGMHGHHELPRILNKVKRSEFQNFIIQSFTKVDKIFLSSENLEDFEQGRIDKLRDYIPDSIKITIVFFVRRYSKILPSRWQEDIKHGSFETLPEYLLRNIAKPFLSSVLNYNEVIKKWSLSFGRESIKLVSYDNLVDSGQDIADYFSKSILGVSINFNKIHSKINVSLGSEIIEIIRIINFIHFNNYGVQSLHSRFYLLKLLDFGVINLDSLIKQLERYKTNLSIEDGSYTFKNLHNFLIKNYGDCFVNISESAVFENTRTETIEYINPSALFDAKLNSEIDCVYLILKDYLLKNKLIKDLKIGSKK